MELPEKKLTDFIKGSEKEKWIPVNNHNVNNFTEDEIKRITKNYSTPIGQGGFGQVYRGSLDDGTRVAVKKYICQNVKDGFAKEIIVHCQINHKNVVRLLGYCSENNALMIVTEYVPSGNLKDLLHGSDAPISLDARLRIAIECADALGYMHSSMYQPMIHGDIKPDNILLDNNLGVKLSDFGLSRLLSMHQTQYTQNVIGSIGYMDPEYIETGILDPKSDVHSFGVVLLELITRAKANENGFNSLKTNFTSVLGRGEKEARQMFDAELANERDIETLDEIGDLAAQCFTKDIKERPEMKEVLWSLQMLRRSLWCEQARLPENKLTDFIKGCEKSKWIAVNNHNVKNFTEDDIKRITNNYSTPIGQGCFGQVYQGSLDDGTTVAVKKYFCQNMKDGFAKEIFVHCQINHKNVVRLLGYCSEDDALMIVTEYVPGGNLKDLLHGSDGPISLDARLRIAIECADALGYMHSSMYQPLIHGDIKPDNILLDNNLGAKLSDFGLSRVLSMHQTQYTMTVTGSRGYMDPEYIMTGLLDPKSDVYSFGVVLLELITRSKASKNGFSTGLQTNFIGALGRGKKEARQMFDTQIAKERDIEILDEIGDLAAQCFTKDIKIRPEMKEVLGSLQMLRRSLRCEKSQEKKGQRSSSGTQAITQMVDDHGSSIPSSSSTSTVTYKFSILDIFSKKSHTYESYGGSILKALNVTFFTSKELRKITSQYSNLIGRGMASTVYLGHIQGQVVAVKQLSRYNFGKDNFVRIMVRASTIHHMNIIKLLGCCLETEPPQLVLEYAHQGNLHDHLHCCNGTPSLDLRLDIAIGSAEALEYLHSTHIMLGNLKSSNIMLDHDFLPKLSDIISTEHMGPYLYEICCNTTHMDPVYIMTQQLRPNSDVYSFGIVLLELITRKKPTYDVGEYNFSLPVEYIKVCRNENSGRAMFDKEIAVQGNIFILEEMGKLAVDCLKEDVNERPKMAEVVERLQKLRRDLKHAEPKRCSKTPHPLMLISK